MEDVINRPVPSNSPDPKVSTGRKANPRGESIFVVTGMEVGIEATDVGRSDARFQLLERVEDASHKIIHFPGTDQSGLRSGRARA